MDLDEAADRLYGVAPAEFVAVRADLRRRAREDGDAALARAIVDLRKPTVAAWAVNQLVRDHPAELDELLDIGERLRRAWRDQDAGALAELSGRRSTVTGRLTRLARHAAEQRGQALSATALTEVEQTFDAALVDTDAADQVRRGRLVRTLRHSGFAPAPVAPSEDETPGAAKTGRGGRSEARAADEVEERRVAERARRRKALREAAESAERAAAEAERDHVEWQAVLADAEAERERQAELVRDLESRLSEARERLMAVERRLGVVRRDEETARRAAALRRRAAEARRALEE